MIQLKMSKYNRTEKEFIAGTLRKAICELVDTTDCSARCMLCEFKHVCDDLDRAFRFAEQSVKGGDTND